MKTTALSIHERIRLEAFLLSERAGHPAGKDDFFWKQAEGIVRGGTRAAKSPQPKSKAGKPAKPTKKPAPAPEAIKAAPDKASAAPKNKLTPKGKAKPAAKRKK